MSASAVLKLQKAGFTTEQVEALADFMDTQAASKADLIEVKTELKEDIRETERRLDVKISETKADLLKSILAIVISAATLNAIAVFGAMFGLAKLLGH